MVIDIKLCRFDNVSWGFRLVGGSDFEYPLTVVKVKEGSLAEQSELKVNDVIVRVNDEATSPLTHEEVDKLIRSSGNTLFLGIRRQTENAVNNQEDYHANAEEYSNMEEKEEESIYESYTTDEVIDQEYDVIQKDEVDGQVTECPIEANDRMERSISILSEDSERKLVEDEIEAVLNNETETPKQQEELRITPKSGICMSSDVLCALNETKAEKEQEKRKWTTFLQKPNRPIPKSKQQIEAERRQANAYKVTIVKSKRPSITQLANEELDIENEKCKDIISQAEVEPEPEAEAEPERDISTPIDSEVPNLEEEIHLEYTNENNVDEEKSVNESEQELKEKEQDVQEQQDEILTEELSNKQTEEELALEQQLADVQKQLAALSNLPSTIQITLDSVTRQLAELVPVLRSQQQTEQIGTGTRIINLEKIDEDPITESNEDVDNAEGNDNYKSSGDKKVVQIEDDNITEYHKKPAKTMYENDETLELNEYENEKKLLNNKMTKQIVSDANEELNTIDRNSINQQQNLLHDSEMRHYLNQANGDTDTNQDIKCRTKKQKRYDIIDEIEEHSKRTKRAFGPITPLSDRPLVLPGGRRWYRPKDAYNDEFIAETLSAQAELISGTALGVNFMKYQKPEKKIDLNRSEVYKVIHHLDRQPVRGIEVRAPVVPAEADIRKAIHS